MHKISLLLLVFVEKLLDEIKLKNRVCSAPGARYINRKLFISNYVSLRNIDYLKSIFDFFFLKFIWRLPIPKFKISISKYYFDNILYYIYIQ